MKRIGAITLAFCATALILFDAWAQQPAPPRGDQKTAEPKRRFQRPGSYQLTAEEKSAVESKTAGLGTLLDALRARNIDSQLLSDVEVFHKAAQWLLEFPDGFYTQDYVGYALGSLDKGIERANLLVKGQSPWVEQKGRKIHGYYSHLDGSVQPYGLTVPESYDGSKAVPLFVFLHGRTRGLTEASFIDSFLAKPPSGNAASYDGGQIHLDVYGRGNNAYHWAGEVDVFEAIAAVEQRYNIDPDRIVLRGFSLGGAGAWHLALHHPDRFVAAEIGAGTWPRRYLMPGFPPYQQATLRIWENIPEWALNAFDIPIAGHGGDSDDQVASIPPPPRGEPTRGQLESSIKVREQLAKEGFPSEGEPDFLRATGTPSIFLISQETKHGISPLVRERLNAFIKEHVGRGRQSPDHVRFVSYTTRYNKAHWVAIGGLGKHYERAEVDARRTNGGKSYEITTGNIARLELRETSHAEQIKIDGQRLDVKPAARIALEKSGTSWRVASGPLKGLHKTHALQGPIDDAFLDPFLLVRPTGKPWNEAANHLAIKRLEDFDRDYAANYRAHPRIKNDTEVSEADFARYNVALFGDPGSNRWIARLHQKLPIGWSKETVTVGGQMFASREHLPVLIYPNPLAPSRYIVINSGLTISARSYNSDYSMPMLGDFAVLKLSESENGPDVALAGLFDEKWQLPAGLASE